MTDTATPDPQSTFDDDRHRHHWPDLQTEITLERFGEASGDLKAEATIRCELPPTTGTLYRGKVNLLSERSMKMLANTLKEQAPKVDWWTVLQQASIASVDRYRDGAPLLDLATVTLPDRPRWILEPLLEAGGPTVIFAPGGSGKSFLGLSIAVSIATGIATIAGTPTVTGPVAYLDWESDPETQRERLDRITAGLDLTDPPPIWYRREEVPIRSSADQLRYKLAERGCVAAVIDSIGWARGGAPESAEETIRTFTAIRRLGLPCVCIDHVTKEAVESGKSRTAFGSVYTTNAARLAWSVAPRWTDGRVDLRLENTKANNGPRAEPMGVTLEFGTSSVFLYTTDPPLIDPAANDGTVPAWKRIAGVLADNGPLSTVDLAEATGILPGTIRKTLNRYGDRFSRDPEGRWDNYVTPF